ncbi:MAG TPA: 3-deoxy-7-phosphoheptulonate synthase [Candidatus Peribacterales bacterium]|nr:3-deoxy-7-phosphoheptulonate synthase [Candidatus Peribacterales bacterium]
MTTIHSPGEDIKGVLPTAEEIAAKYPANISKIAQDRKETRAIIEGIDHRLLALFGPCSAWPFAAMPHFADKAARLQERVNERVKIIIRTVIQKPRTRLRKKDWEGPMKQPDPLKPPDLILGTELCAAMMKNLSDRIASGDEMLFTHNGRTFDPYISYLWMGARSTTDSEHRGMASRTRGIPFGVKHDTYGSIEVGVNGVEAVQTPQDIFLDGQWAETHGNSHGHLILRGSPDKPNYDAESIKTAARMMTGQDNYDYVIENPSIMVDASHDNCRDFDNGKKKDPSRQLLVIRHVLQNMLEQREGHDLVKGFMGEMFIVGGSRKIETGMDYELGKSITDPCSPFEDMETIIQEMADKYDQILSKRHF